MNNKIRINDIEYSFYCKDIDLEIDLDDITSIDYSNIIGDMAYTTILSNQFGLIKAELEKEVKNKSLEVEKEEADFILSKRKESNKNEGFFFVDGVKIKNTEKALEKVYRYSNKWRRLQNELYTLECNLSKIESIYWKLSDKLKRLEYPVTLVYPNDMTEDLIFNKFNRMIQKKIKNETK